MKYAVAFIIAFVALGTSLGALLGSISDTSDRHKSFAENHEDITLITNLKEECEEVHQTECEISVYYLPKASVPYDRE